jgi:hypothetical protein
LFFTVNLLQRHRNDLLIREISLLRETVRRVRTSPFSNRRLGCFAGTFTFGCRIGAVMLIQ